MIATPSVASALTRSSTSRLAPTSMPRVGSLRISSFGCTREPLRQHDLLLVATAQVAGEQTRVRRPDARPRDQGRRDRQLANLPNDGSHEVFEMGQRDVLEDLVAREERRAPVLRQIGDAEPFRFLGRLRRGSARPSSRTMPELGRIWPNSARATSVIPAPRKPKMPEDLARSHREADVVEAPWRMSASISKTGGSGGRRRQRHARPRSSRPGPSASAPIMRLIRWCLVSPSFGSVATLREFLSTVTRSATASTSSRKWEMKIRLLPRAFSSQHEREEPRRLWSRER